MSPLQWRAIPCLHYVVEGCTWHIKEQSLCSVSIAISLNASLFIMLQRNQNRRYVFYFRIMKRTQTRYFPNERAKCLRDSGGDKKMEFQTNQYQLDAAINCRFIACRLNTAQHVSGHPLTHHQEPINCSSSSSLWFTYCHKR